MRRLFLIMATTALLASAALADTTFHNVTTYRGDVGGVDVIVIEGIMKIDGVAASGDTVEMDGFNVNTTAAISDTDTCDADGSFLVWDYDPGAGGVIFFLQAAGDTSAGFTGLLP